MNSLISIIIPVYNRANVISETLDSIINQSYYNWECIIIDDGSYDNTIEILKNYSNSDKRIKYFKRPNHISKGANPCRNYGFKICSGNYIKWFDSDDIMLPKHLEVAMNTLVNNNLDFVVTDTLNFEHESGKLLDKPYNFDRNNAIISAQNFALNHVGWITDDFLGTHKIVEKIKFNEYIVDGDEYNFFIKLLQQDFKGMLINEVLTYRRIHKENVTIINQKNNLKYLSIIASIKYHTAKDLVDYNNKELIRWFLSGYMRYSFDLALQNQSIPYYKQAFYLICKYYSYTKAFIFILALIGGRYFKKGYNIMKYARK